MVLPLPKDPTRRALALGITCSILLHLLLFGFVIARHTPGSPIYVKRGEPLLVDLAPERPEEKAPLGNPARPVAPEPPPPARRPAEPPPTKPIAPKVTPRPEAPKSRVVEAPPPITPPAPKPIVPPPSPAPPPQVAKAEPAPKAPEPAPPPQKAPEPVPPPKPSEPVAAKPPEPQPARPSDATPAPSADASRQQLAPPSPSQAAPAQQPTTPGDRGPTQTALARPPERPSIFRNPSGGGGIRGGSGGVEGEPIPLDTQEPKYQDYFNKIRDKIKSKWIYPREAGERGLQGELLIEFHIAKDGRLEYLSLRRTSGEEILDQFAMNAIRLAQPFPPVPDDIAKKILAINGLFRYQIVGASLLNQYLR